MPIRGYLEPRPRGAFRRAAGGVPILGEGIAVRGPVLEGGMSLHEALVMDRIRAIREREVGRNAEADAKVFGGVDRLGFSHPQKSR